MAIQARTEEQTGPTIPKGEVNGSIETTKGGKALGPDEIAVGVLKLIETQHLDSIIALFNRACLTGTLPAQ